MLSFENKKFSALQQEFYYFSTTIASRELGLYKCQLADSKLHVEPRVFYSSTLLLCPSSYY